MRSVDEACRRDLNRDARVALSQIGRRRRRMSSESAGDDCEMRLQSWGWVLAGLLHSLPNASFSLPLPRVRARGVEGAMAPLPCAARGGGQCGRCGRFLSIQCVMSTRKRGLGGKKGPDVCFIPSLPDGCCIRMMGLMGDEAAQIRTTRHAPAGCSTSSSLAARAPARARARVPVRASLQGAASFPLFPPARLG